MVASSDQVAEMVTVLMRVFARVRDAERHSKEAGDLSLLAGIAQHDGIAPSALAVAMNMHPSQLSRRLRAFQEGGLIQSTAQPHDRRSSLVTLTADGWAELARLVEVGIERFGRFVEEFEESELRQLTEYLARIDAAITRSARK
jgi:DNA-binding MarR family transcriptional regulator